MNNPADNADQVSVVFFAKVSAAISHEINNVLATLQENAGLLSDYMGLVEQGREIDPLRLEKVASRMAEQVKRGQGIVARMNRFAHSGDHGVAAIDLGETVELVCQLFTRPASVAGLSLEYQDQGQRVRLVTRPFVLEALLWRVLELAADRAAKSPQCLLCVRPTPNGGIVEIRRDNSTKDDLWGIEDEPRVMDFLADLGASWEPGDLEGSRIIRLTDQAGQDD